MTPEHGVCITDGGSQQDGRCWINLHCSCNMAQNSILYSCIGADHFGCLLIQLEAKICPFPIHYLQVTSDHLCCVPNGTIIQVPDVQLLLSNEAAIFKLTQRYLFNMILTLNKQLDTHFK